MIKCEKCDWQGQRYELKYVQNPCILKEENDFGYLNINNWKFCPNCNATINTLLDITPTALNFAYNFSVLSISTNSIASSLASNLFGQIPITYIHLSRILDFVINTKNLNVLGFKNYSNQLFKLNINSNFDFESIILLKIIHLAHLHKSKCEFKTTEGYTLFGRWSTLRETMYPLRSCSFCARFYEWQQKQSNGWPLSVAKLQKMNLDSIKQLSGVPTHANNKFAKIFTNEEKKSSKYSICTCNEISPRPNPNCEVHKNSLIISI